MAENESKTELRALFYRLDFLFILTAGLHTFQSQVLTRTSADAERTRVVG